MKNSKFVVFVLVFYVNLFIEFCLTQDSTEIQLLTQKRDLDRDSPDHAISSRFYQYALDMIMSRIDYPSTRIWWIYDHGPPLTTILFTNNNHIIYRYKLLKKKKKKPIREEGKHSFQISLL